MNPLFVVLMISSISPVFSQVEDLSNCGYGRCFQYVPEQNVSPFMKSNWSMDVFLPTGKCNINGFIQPNGDCNVPPIILSDSNFTDFKSDIAVMSVNNIHTTTSLITTNYCPLALFTLVNQDGYIPSKIPYNETTLIYPTYCYQETGPSPIPVPEFSFTSLIFAISIMGIILWRTKT